MRTIIKLAPVVSVTVLLLGGCAYGPHDQVGVAVADNDYYDGYYDGAYGPFNDRYWGSDGAFWYSDSNHNWNRDNGNHFRHDAGDGNGWTHVHGSGAHRDH